METDRDLAEAAAWRESQTRSRARRARSTRASTPQSGSDPAPPPEKQDRHGRRSPSTRLERRKAIARRRRTVKQSSYGLVLLVLVGGILATVIAGYSHPGSRTAVHANATREGGPYTHAHQLATGFAGDGLAKHMACPLVVRSTGYANPLAGATVKPERIDQGVDYAGSGTLIAMGDARVTLVSTENNGWPGAFVEYKLLRGPDAGCYVFYAEGITPAPWLRVGRTLRAGETLATIIPQYPTGFEIGWGSGGADAGTYAAKTGGWTPEEDQNNRATGPGKNFSALIAALGGPPGKVEG